MIDSFPYGVANFPYRFLFCRERLISSHVILGLPIFGFGLQQRGLGGVRALLRGNEAGVVDVGLGGAALA